MEKYQNTAWYFGTIFDCIFRFFVMRLASKTSLNFSGSSFDIFSSTFVSRISGFFIDNGQLLFTKQVSAFSGGIGSEQPGIFFIYKAPAFGPDVPVPFHQNGMRTFPPKEDFYEKFINR